MLFLTIVLFILVLIRVEYLGRKLRAQERTIAELRRRTGIDAEAAPREPARAAAAKVKRAREDWETRLGTNWLNRAGALVLVIGIALFLGYSLTQLGPAGKAAIGFAVGVSLLAGGTVLERRPVYRTYAYSLVGAGWAVSYFTAYAVHGLEAARLIDSPIIGTALLLAISAAMILHALRFRSETATALAYLFAFASLNVTALTPFSIIASLLLAVSLIVLAYRLSWFALPLAGVLFTYLTFVLRYDPTVYGRAGLTNGQATLWIYWLSFEVFDILESRRRGETRWERSLFLLNACGFIGASVLHLRRVHEANWAVFYGLAAIAYVISTAVRWKWTPVRAAVGRILPQGFEAAATASAGLLAAGMIEQFAGVGITMALALEGEMVFLAALMVGNVYLGRLGAAVLALPFLRVLLVDAGGSGGWTATACVLAAVFAMNRLLVRTAWPFAAAAGALLLFVSAKEFRSEWVAPAWTAVALAAFEIARRFNQEDLHWMSFAGGLLACVPAFLFNAVEAKVVTGALAVAGVYALGVLFLRDKRRPSAVLSVAATVVLTRLLASEVQGRLLTVAWGIEAAALIAAGFVLNQRVLRYCGLLLLLSCIGKAFVYDLRQLDIVGRILSFIVLGVLLLAASWVYTRFRDKLKSLL